MASALLPASLATPAQKGTRRGSAQGSRRGGASGGVPYASPWLPGGQSGGDDIERTAFDELDQFDNRLAAQSQAREAQRRGSQLIPTGGGWCSRYDIQDDSPHAAPHPAAAARSRSWQTAETLSPRQPPQRPPAARRPLRSSTGLAPHPPAEPPALWGRDPPATSPVSRRASWYDSSPRGGWERRDGAMGFMTRDSRDVSPREVFPLGGGEEDEHGMHVVLNELQHARTVIDYQERVLNSQRDALHALTRPGASGVFTGDVDGAGAAQVTPGGKVPPPTPETGHKLTQSTARPAEQDRADSPVGSGAPTEPASSLSPMAHSPRGCQSSVASMVMDCDFDAGRDRTQRRFRRTIGRAAGVRSRQVRLLAWERGSVKAKFQLAGCRNADDAEMALRDALAKLRDPKDPIQDELPGPVQEGSVEVLPQPEEVPLGSQDMGPLSEDSSGGTSPTVPVRKAREVPTLKVPTPVPTRGELRSPKPEFREPTAQSSSFDSSSTFSETEDSELDLITEDERGDEQDLLRKQEKEGQDEGAGFAQKMKGKVATLRLTIKFLRPSQMKNIRLLVIVGVAVALFMFVMFLVWKLNNTEPTLGSSFEAQDNPANPGLVVCPHPFSLKSETESMCGFTRGEHMYHPENWIASCAIDGPLEVKYENGTDAKGHKKYRGDGLKECYAVPHGAIYWDDNKPHPSILLTMVFQKPVEYITWGMFDSVDADNVQSGGFPAPQLLTHEILSTGTFSLAFSFKEKKEMNNVLDPTDVTLTPQYEPQLVPFRECLTCPGIPQGSNPHVKTPDKAVTIMMHPRSLWKEVLFQKPSFTVTEMMPMLAAVGTAILKMREVLVGRGKVEDPYNPWGVVQKLFVNLRRPEVLDSKTVRATRNFMKSKAIKNKEYFKVTDKFIRKRYCKASDMAFGRDPRPKKKLPGQPEEPAEESEAEE